MLFDINFEKRFDKPGSDDWVVVGVGEVGTLVVPAGEVLYHMTKCTFQEVKKLNRTQICADDPSPFKWTTIIHSSMRTIQDRGLVADTLDVVHPKSIRNWAEPRLYCSSSRRVSKHPKQFFLETLNQKNDQLLVPERLCFNKPAHYKSILVIVSIITDRKAIDKDVPFVRSRPAHQCDL